MARTKEVARRGYREVLPRKELAGTKRKHPPQPPLPLKSIEPHSDSDSEFQEISYSESEEKSGAESEENSDPPAPPPPRAILDPDEDVVPKREEQLFPLLDQPPKRRSSARKKSPIITDTEEDRFLSSDQPPNRRIAVRKENCSLTHSPTTQDEAKNPKILSAESDVGLTLDDLIRWSGEKLEGIGEKLGVTRPTLKRLCQELSSYWWPLLKRNKVDEILSNPSTSVEPVSGETIKDPKNRSCSNNNATEKVGSATNSILTGAEGKTILMKHLKTESTYTMIVKATYRGDSVKFPLCGSSGIGKLRCELDKRFKLKVESFKIKYEDNGEWIMLCCDEDLRFHMDSLKASGLTMMKLSVSLPN